MTKLGVDDVRLLHVDSRSSIGTGGTSVSNNLLDSDDPCLGGHSYSFVLEFKDEPGLGSHSYSLVLECKDEPGLGSHSYSSCMNITSSSNGSHSSPMSGKSSDEISSTLGLVSSTSIEDFASSSKGS